MSCARSIVCWHGGKLCKENVGRDGKVVLEPNIGLTFRQCFKPCGEVIGHDQENDVSAPGFPVCWVERERERPKAKASLPRITREQMQPQQFLHQLMVVVVAMGRWRVVKAMQRGMTRSHQQQRQTEGMERGERRVHHLLQRRSDDW